MEVHKIFLYLVDSRFSLLININYVVGSSLHSCCTNANILNKIYRYNQCIDKAPGTGRERKKDGAVSANTRLSTDP